MSNKLKDIDIKNHAYSFFHGIISIKNLDPNKIKTDEKSYKKFFVNYIRYVTIRDSKCVKINGANTLYFINNKMNEYLEEINGNENLTLVTTNESKEKLKT